MVMILNIIMIVTMVIMMTILMMKMNHHDCGKRATGDILTDHYSEQPDPPDKDKKMIFWARIKHDRNVLNISSKH